MVEKIIRKTPEEKNSNGFKRVKLLASVALAGTLAACGSREESAPGIPSAGGAVGSAGATSGGSTTGGAANAGGTTSSGGSTQAGGNAGEAEGGAPACPVNVEYNLSCDSLSSVPKTMVVGEEVNLGVSNGAIVVRLAEITGRNFDTAQWHASNETCDQYQISISEGQSSDLWVATNVVNVRVNEISPDPVTQVALVNVVFSAVCEGGAGGSAGEGGTTSGAGGQATGGTGNSAGIGGSSGEAGVGGISGSAGMSGAGGATGGVGGVSGAGGATGGVGGVSGAGGATSGAGGQETGGAGGSVTSG
ncbi:hypothetical protein JXA56_02085, partial [Candidatus Micrarchaeota archaeon]|nr:hypothetical protein [Candidatus Micrarchaeota archaeon]